MGTKPLTVFILLNALVLTEVDITEFHKVIFAGFVDTLPFYRQIMPEWKKLLCSQEALFHDIVGGSYTAHNANSDVQSLQSIVEKCDQNRLLLKIH